MELEANYEIAPTADFIYSRNFTRVALQFPDDLLKDSTRVVRALREQLRSLRKCSTEKNGDSNKDVRLFVMADTTFGSCCVDEVGALHADAECVVHYGHTCLSPTTTLPAFFVFGKASISVSNFVEGLSNYALTNGKRVVVLYGLEYAHSIKHIREAVEEASRLSQSKSKSEIRFADVKCSVMNPSDDHNNSNGLVGPASNCTDNSTCGTRPANSYSIGGLTWSIPDGQRMEDYLLFWIGSDNSAFANVVMTFNGCDIVRYDATENCLVTDVSQQKRILKRRYFLVEKAKDANIIGILVGTLGVAGYLHMIHQMKELITAAGKKAYTLVMGKPNPAKLANFPECDVFIFVSCAQTALLESKEYLSPVITPFEAMLTFNRGSQWTGEYVMEFRDLINSCPVEVRNGSEARFSFFHGGYVEDFDLLVHKQRDIIPLDANGDIVDSDDEIPVFDLKGMNDDEDEDDEIGDIAKMTRTQKYLREKFGGVEDAMLEDDEEDEEEQESLWGGKKKEYYHGDNADYEAQSSDVDGPLKEEEAVKKLQTQKSESYRIEDFGLDVIEDCSDSSDRELTLEGEGSIFSPC